MQKTLMQGTIHNRSIIPSPSGRKSNPCGNRRDCCAFVTQYLCSTSIMSQAPFIRVDDLTFAFPDGSTGLQKIFLDLPAGSRTLLIGGKSFLPR